MSFETELMRGIPLADAADFFIRVRGSVKEATVEDLRGALAELSLDERAELLKSAAPQQLPPTAQGQNPPIPPPMPLPPAAAGQTATPGMKIAAGTPEEQGVHRSRANFAAGVEKDRLTQGERTGSRFGAVAGTLGGIAAGLHAGKGAHPGVAAATLAGGAYLGHKAGKGLGAGVGHEVDKHRFKHLPAEEKAASAMKLALEQMQGGQEPGQPGPPGQPAPQGAPKPLPAPQAIEPELDPATQQYIAMEQQAQEATAVNEAEHLREQLSAVQTQAQASQAEADMLKQQAEMHQQQLEMSQAQIQASMQQATQAQDQVLAGQQSAAAMRMALQQMRGGLLEMASKEPPTDALSGGMSPGVGADGSPASPAVGPAGQAASPGAAPGAAPAAGEDPVNANASGADPAGTGTAQPASKVEQQEPTGDAKTPNKEVVAHARPFVGSLKSAALRDFLPHAAAGALIGAGAGALESRGDNEPLRAKVQGLQAKPDRGLRDTLGLMQSQARLTAADFAKTHPKTAIGAGAVMGGLTGAFEGPELVQRARQGASAIGKNLKTLRG